MRSVDNQSPTLGCVPRPIAGTAQWLLYGASHSGGDVRQIPIESNPFTIGRKSNTSLCLTFGTVSGLHALIHVNGNELSIQDMKSTNGTFVNGVRLTDEKIALKEDDLIHFAEAPFRIRKQANVSDNSGTIAENISDQALALVQFDRLMTHRLVAPHQQPIVDLGSHERHGFEILGRSRLFGLESAASLFGAAKLLGLEVELSQMLRQEGVLAAQVLDPSYWIYFNIHPKELQEGAFFDSLASLRALNMNVPLVLEIHEAAITSPKMMCDLHARLKDLNIFLAYDDFGSGQARLSELITARPWVIKFDMSLIRDIDKADAHHRRVVRNLVSMVRDLDVQPLAEGIETAEEAQCCKDLGFALGQGYFFGKPAPISP